MLEVGPFYADLGRRLRALRIRQKLTQHELGASLVPPVTRASIANIEMGKQRVLAHSLVQLADALRVSLADLLPPQDTGKEEMIRDELLQKLALPDDRLHRLVEKLAPPRKRRTRR